MFSLKSAGTNSSKFFTINEGNKNNFEFYLTSKIIPTSIFVNNTSSKIFDDPFMADFLYKYGSKITRVKIQNFNMCESKNEKYFLSNLKNIEYLSLYRIENLDKNAQPLDTCIPDNLKNLNTLILRESHANCREYTRDLMFFCDRVTHIRLPCMKLSRKLLVHYIQHRERHQLLPSIKILDLKFQTGLSSSELCFLLEKCSNVDAKLHNVSSELLQEVSSSLQCNGGGTKFKNIFTPQLSSIINTREFIFTQKMINLKKIRINSTWLSNYAESFPFVIQDDNLPRLCTLYITVDSEDMFGNMEIQPENTMVLLHALFNPSIVRTSLRKLAVKFARKPKESCQYELPVPNVANILKSCPFIVNLELANWVGRNKDATKFWNGLPLLRIITLEGCKYLTDDSFIGRSERDPIFLKLKRKFSVLNS